MTEVHESTEDTGKRARWGVGEEEEEEGEGVGVKDSWERRKRRGVTTIMGRD